MQVRRDGRGLAHCRDQLWADMVHLDRGEPQPLDAWNRAGLAGEPRGRIGGRAVAEVAEIHRGEDDLAMALRTKPGNVHELSARSTSQGAVADVSGNGVG